MKTFDVSESIVREFVPVNSQPYPHITLGEGGNKRATWVALGKRDAPTLVLPAEERDGKRLPDRITEAGIVKLENGQYLIVAPRGSDNRAIVLWHVASGYRGSASISAQEDVLVIACDASWHSGRGNLGKTAECLAVLRPEQNLDARISGRRVQENRARLSWDGREINVEFFCNDAVTEGEGGEYV